MKLSARSSVVAGLCGLAIASLWYAGAGCGSSNGGSSTGGTTATGGSSATGGSTATGGGAPGGATGTGGVITATGGATATGGVSGTGGATGTGGTSACTAGMAPTAPLISDFDLASAGSSGLNVGGGAGLYAYGGAKATLTEASNKAVTVTVASVTSTQYPGAAISLGACTDASTFSGVKFKLSGVTLGGCDLSFGLNFGDDTLKTDDPRGSCTLGSGMCYGPAITIKANTAMVAFADLTGGAPTAFDKSKHLKSLLSVSWQVHPSAAGADGGASSCSNVSFTIDDVSFY